MQDYRDYANGQNYVQPGATESISQDIKRVPGQIWGWVAAVVFGTIAWRWTKNEDAALLFGLLGALIVLIYFKIERLFYQQQIREEITRGVVREVAANVAHDVAHLTDSLDERVPIYKPDYSDLTRDA